MKVKRLKYQPFSAFSTIGSKLLGAAAMAAAVMGLAVLTMPGASAQTATDPQGQPAGGQLPGAQPPAPVPVDITQLANSDVQKIAAIVNDTPITEYDVYQRLALIVTQAGFQLTASDLKRMREQILRTLIDETLKLQEALNFDIQPKKSEVDEELESIAAQNSMTVQQIEDMLAEQQIGISTFRRQIAAEIVWQRVIQGRFYSSISVTDEEVNAVYQRTIANASKPQYRVQEVFIRVDSPEQDAEVQRGLIGIWQQLEQGANFSAVAQQISFSPSAAQGGDMGWVQDGQLPPELNMVLRNMQKGEISKPIRTITGYYILKLLDRRLIGGADPMKAKVTMRQLVFPLAENTAQEQVQAAGTYLMQASQAIKSCQDLEAFQKKLGSGYLSDEQTMTIGELAPIFQPAVIPLQANEISAPLLSNQGFHLIAVCAREDVGINLPDKAQIENNLANQQLSMFARRYIRDLRNDAVVELR